MAEEKTLWERLAEPFPKEWEKQKPVFDKFHNKTGDLTFVPWYRYVERLNALCPGMWSTRTMQTVEVGDRLLVEVEVTIDGVPRANWGDEKVGVELYGTTVVNAWAQGFKRALAGFGMGLYFYHGSDPLEADEERQPTKAEQAKAREVSAKAQEIAKEALNEEGWQNVEITFGKHSGKTVGDLAQSKEGLSYLQWLTGDSFDI
ncbi:MAG: hypothetical protein ABIH46_08355, partial [Chloroflexota bacterium]